MMLASIELSDVRSVVALAVSAAVGVRLLMIVRTMVNSPSRDRLQQHWKQLRWRHILPVPLVAGAVGVTAAILWLIPPLRFGWWSLIGGQGSAVFGSSDTTSQSWWGRLIPLLFIVMIAFALPMLAESEERMFRLGAEQWTMARRALRCIQFGLIHLVVGIPIAVALALSVGGAYFMWRYLHTWNHTFNRVAALNESTRAHLGYNAVLITLAAISFAVI
jgi:hypothetical protein